MHIMKSNLKKIWIIFILQLIFNVSAIQVQYQDELIEPSKMISLPTQNLVMTERNVDQNFIIKQPMSIGMVYSMEIQKINENIKCTIVDWPIYKQTSVYYNILQKTQKDKNSMDLQIISATFYKESEYFVFFVLTSIGQIRMVRKHPLNFDQTIKVYICSGNIDITKFDQLDEAYLYNTKGNVYLYVDNQIYLIKLQEQTHKFTLSLMNLCQEKTKKVVQAQDKLYLLCQKSSIWTIQKNLTSKLFSVDDVLLQNSSLQIKPLKLQTISIDQGVIYALDKQNGILRINSNNQITVLRIQYANFAVGVSVYKKTMIVSYLIRQQTYITQYFLDSSNNFKDKGVHLNKIYTNYRDIKNVIMLDKYFLVGTQSQLIVGMHSINRNSPLAFHQKSQYLSNQYMNQIYELHSITNGQFPLSYMIVLKKSLSVVQFYQNQRLKYKQSWIQCKSNALGQYQMTVAYQGTCASEKLSTKSDYCKKTMNVKINIKDSINEKNTNQWKLILVLLGLLIASAIVGLILRKFIMTRQRIFQQKLKGKQRVNNGKRGVSKQLMQIQFDKTHQFNISQIQDGE